MFLVHSSRNPGIFNSTNFSIHFETYTGYMKILYKNENIASVLNYFVDPRFVRYRTASCFLVSCQSFSRCLGQANGKIFSPFAESRWNSSWNCESRKLTLLWHLDLVTNYILHRLLLIFNELLKKNRFLFSNFFFFFFQSHVSTARCW